MAEKEEKKEEKAKGKDKDKGKKEDAGKEGGKEAAPKDPNAQMTKKNKIILFAGIGGILLLVLAIGGFIVFKTIKAKKQAEFEMSQEMGPTEVTPEGGAPAPAKEGEPKKEDSGHGEPKKDEKGGHGEPKKDEKGGHGEPKKEEKGGHGEPKKDDKGGHGEPKKEESKGTTNFGDTYTFPKMDLNLGNPIENRFLRVAVAIEYRGGEEQQDELKKREIQIKDIIITTVTTKTRVQLLTENGKELLRREILNKINEVSDRPVQNVFFTEFLVE